MEPVKTVDIKKEKLPITMERTERELINEELTPDVGSFVNLDDEETDSVSDDSSDLNPKFEFEDNDEKSVEKVEKNSLRNTSNNEEVINCICGYHQQFGFMVQCNVCLTWQHALCCGIKSEHDVPDSHLCAYCIQPKNVRPSHKYSYAKHLTLSKLPRFSRRTCQEEVLKRRQGIFRQTFEMTANLKTIAKIERTVSIAQEPNHPKLYMWSANSDSQDPLFLFYPSTSGFMPGPIGERRIESADCRLRHLDKIESDQRKMNRRLSMISDQFKQLESGDYEKEAEENNPKQVLKKRN